MLFKLIITIVICYYIYIFVYFRSENFIEIKESVAVYIEDCNELNIYIRNLKARGVEINKIDYGEAIYKDRSLYNYRRPSLKKENSKKNIHKCSLGICRKAKEKPFEYICKYFYIKNDEETLEIFEKILNDFSAAQQGKNLLHKKRKEIMNMISNKIPFIIKIANEKRLMKRLGFNQVDITPIEFPTYRFIYISPGGNSELETKITLDIQLLDRFVEFLANKIKFRKSIRGQRALMTTALRERIKVRDNYTCKICGLSKEDEQHLLLEIDHIIPLSKGGLTIENNLQTLCWKCNRSKGNKINWA